MTVPKLSRRAFSAMMLGAAGTILVRAGKTSTDSAGTPETWASPPAAEWIAHPTGSDDLIVRIDFRQDDQLSLTVMPIVSLYGDGRVIAQVRHPEPHDHPRPALPDLRLTRLTDEGIQLVLQAARRRAHGG